MSIDVEFFLPLQINLASWLIGVSLGGWGGIILMLDILRLNLHILIMMQFSKAYDLVIYIHSLEKGRMLGKYGGK